METPGARARTVETNEERYGSVYTTTLTVPRVQPTRLPVHGEQVHYWYTAAVLAQVHKWYDIMPG